MDKATFEKYLQERYYDQMNYYDKKSGFYQNRYKKFQWILIILSALTPIIAAFQGSKIFDMVICSHSLHIIGENLNIIVVIISAIVAILTTGLKSFQYQELWVTYRLTQELLKPEIYYYQFNVGPYADASIDKESLFVTRVETILDKEHSSWPPAKKLKDNDGKGEQVEVDTNTIKSEASVKTTETTTTTTTVAADKTTAEGAATVASDKTTTEGAATVTADKTATEGAATVTADKTTIEDAATVIEDKTTTEGAANADEAKSDDSDETPPPPATDTK